MQVGTPVYLDTASGIIVIEKPWRLLGWCDKLDSILMIGREGQIGLLMWHPDKGEVWEHYPLFDEDERSTAIFQSRPPR
jgi:hypothetical protein